VVEMNDSELMERALAQASRGLEEGAMPIGAVLALEGEILAEAYWRGVSRGLLSHPEHALLMQADASMSFKVRRQATLYTTLEPCLMCMGTAMSFLLGRIVYAMAAPADGAANVAERWRPELGHPSGDGPYSLPVIEGGVGEAEARALVVAWLESGVTGAEANFARGTLG
jgi:tRNA(adenine34) deaminase